MKRVLSSLVSFFADRITPRSGSTAPSPEFQEPRESRLRLMVIDDDVIMEFLGDLTAELESQGAQNVEVWPVRWNQYGIKSDRDATGLHSFQRIMAFSRYVLPHQTWDPGAFLADIRERALAHYFRTCDPVRMRPVLG